MEVLHTIADYRAARAKLEGTLGFVPTMGFFHQGHMELVRRAKAENVHAAVSIFVNPTQFGPNEDLAAYPRDLDRDLAMLREEGTALVFNPTPEEMYPRGYVSYIEIGPVSQPMEGTYRPGHFRGVATVVAKLFNIAQADHAYFGQKDGQQVAVIKRMARDLDFSVKVIVVPTVREPDGLAMSSRNVYLNAVGRKAALCLSRGLFEAQQQWAKGVRDAEKLRQAILDPIEKEPLARIDYVTLADADTMEEASGQLARPTMAALAVRIGKTRLIDDLVLGGVDL